MFHTEWSWLVHLRVVKVIKITQRLISVGVPDWVQARTKYTVMQIKFSDLRFLNIFTDNPCSPYEFVDTQWINYWLRSWKWWKSVKFIKIKNQGSQASPLPWDLTVFKNLPDGYRGWQRLKSTDTLRPKIEHYYWYQSFSKVNSNLMWCKKLPIDFLGFTKYHSGK